MPLRPAGTPLGRWLASALLLLCASATVHAGTPAADAASTVAELTAATAAATANAAVPASGRRLAPEMARIMARGELVVAMLATDTPPFFYERDQRLQGLDVDMAREIAQELGVALRFDRSATSFNGVVDKVSRGEADLGISKISRTLARAKAVLFSDPYLTLHHALILNRLAFASLARERTPLQVMQDFRGSLGVLAKSSFVDFAQANFPKAELRAYASWPELIAAVERGEIVAAYRDEFEIKRLLTERPTVALTLRTITLKDRDDTLGVAMGADASALRAYVNLYLSMRKNKLQIDAVLKALHPIPTGATAP